MSLLSAFPVVAGDRAGTLGIARGTPISLRIDAVGLYRWYLNGWIAMNVKGTTREAAESALARFVQRTLRGDLEITAA